MIVGSVDRWVGGQWMGGLLVGYWPVVGWLIVGGFKKIHKRHSVKNASFMHC